MSCCGGRRQQFLSETQRHGDVNGMQEQSPQSPSTNSAPVYFEYSGTTALTVQGPISRQRYRFAEPGARMAVDRRDAPSLAGVPLLRRVKFPSAADMDVD